MPSPYGQMAIEETIRQGYERDLNLRTQSLSGAIAQAFYWERSEIGFDFWEAIEIDARKPNPS